MRKIEILTGLAAVVLGGCAARERVERMQTGPFEPTWESLSRYETPEWFRDAKFGIWAHWGPQCAPERGDWYARFMYMENAPSWAGDIFAYHRQRYGHPSQFGFKDVIHTWKAENWDPDKLLALYKRVGARYFVALANHHDNFDNWDSRYQPWNSVKVGPKKDLMAGWAEAARRQGLRFGVSVHASHAWTWYEPAQGADKTGPYAGVPYDGKRTKADGKGLWWEGLDPQDLYAQNHPRSADAEDPTAIHRQWEWGNGASIPDEAYCRKFYNRTLDLLNRYRPDLIYFDDTVLPLYPISDVGLRIAAHFYNSSIRWNKGKLEGVLNGKVLTPEQRRCMVWDIERGASPEIEPLPWQTCTCLGSWHYDRRIYEQRRYKSAKTVVHMLVDIVSKNGNLLLSVPLRSDGTIDAEEERILEEIAAWMDVNGEAIYATRPWKVFGEGPAMKEVAPLQGPGFNEGRGRPLTAEDVRYTVSKDGRTLYVFLMGKPAAGRSIALRTLRLKNSSGQGRVSLLGWAGPVDWSIDSAGRLTVNWPTVEPARPFDAYACVLKVSGFEMDLQEADAGEQL